MQIMKTTMTNYGQKMQVANSREQKKYQEKSNLAFKGMSTADKIIISGFVVATTLLGAVLTSIGVGMYKQTKADNADMPKEYYIKKGEQEVRDSIRKAKAYQLIQEGKNRALKGIKNTKTK